ncbi:universal stress protein [Pararhizobium sp. IMCC21322]|uniref:universal stress protein n=1 Tax=Pararhizobium sp. IMCC21322 TaxID=3067903 RepID=UPI002741B31B|nr:universal stress protein [Pararhizobium sp. IMCC21322]
MFKSILLPIDLSSEASWAKALPTALEMMRDKDAELHVVAVLPDFGMPIVESYFKEGYEDEALADFGHKLAAWVSKHVPEDVTVHPHVLHGTIYAEILRAAKELSADVIVLASHRPELSDYLLGPNAARVVRHAKQSVMVVRN